MISILYLNGGGKCPTGPAGLKVPANFSAYRLLSTLIQLYTSGRFFFEIGQKRSERGRFQIERSVMIFTGSLLNTDSAE